MESSPELDIKQLIIYEHDDLIVAWKPCGLISEEDPKGNVNLRYLIHQYIKETYPWKKQLICELAHRIDRPVSGLLLVAKKKSILQALQKQFYLRTVGKYYLAVIEGKLDEREGVLEHYLIKNPRLFKSIPAEASNPEAKIAKLSYRVIATDGKTSLVKIELNTGRFHQIRFQFSQIGTPIWNDAWYGGKKHTQDVRIGLHSYCISFDLPKSGERKRFMKPPDDVEPWTNYKEDIKKLIDEESRYPNEGRSGSDGKEILSEATG